MTLFRVPAGVAGVCISIAVTQEPSVPSQYAWPTVTIGYSHLAAVMTVTGLSSLAVELILKICDEVCH